MTRVQSRHLPAAATVGVLLAAIIVSAWHAALLRLLIGPEKMDEYFGDFSEWVGGTTGAAIGLLACSWPALVAGIVVDVLRASRGVIGWPWSYFLFGALIAIMAVIIAYPGAPEIVVGLLGQSLLILLLAKAGTSWISCRLRGASPL